MVLDGAEVLCVKPSLSDLVDAFEMQGDGVTQYLDLGSGQVILVTGDFQDYEEGGDAVDNLPKWMQEAVGAVVGIRADPDRYLELPAQGDLVTHKTLRSFCHTLPSAAQRDQLLAVLQGKGMFRRFKDRADEMGVLQAWFEFRRGVLEATAIEWCKEHGIVCDAGAV